MSSFLDVKRKYPCVEGPSETSGTCDAPGARRGETPDCAHGSNCRILLYPPLSRSSAQAWLNAPAIVAEDREINEFLAKKNLPLSLEDRLESKTRCVGVDDDDNDDDDSLSQVPTVIERNSSAAPHCNLTERERAYERVRLVPPSLVRFGWARLVLSRLSLAPFALRPAGSGWEIGPLY